MIFEWIENTDIYTVPEEKPFALKKYIAKRLTGTGIPLDQKSTFKERDFGNDVKSEKIMDKTVNKALQSQR